MSASPEILLELQNLRLIPRPPASGSVFLWVPGDTYAYEIFRTTTKTSGAYCIMFTGVGCLSECNLWVFFSLSFLCQFSSPGTFSPTNRMLHFAVSLPCHLLSLAVVHSPGSLRSQWRVLGTWQMARVWLSWSTAQCGTVTCVFMQRPCLPIPFGISNSPFKCPYKWKKKLKAPEVFSPSILWYWRAYSND